MVKILHVGDFEEMLVMVVEYPPKKEFRVPPN